MTDEPRDAGPELEQHEIDLAEHLGEELDLEGRRRLEGRRATDPALADEMQQLEETLALMRRLDAPPVAALGGVLEREADASTPARLWRSLWRYAAVAAVAFLAGSFWTARPTSPAGAPANAGGRSTAESGVESAADPGADPGAGTDFQRRFATSWTARAHRGGLTRTLVALAEASRREADQ